MLRAALAAAVKHQGAVDVSAKVKGWAQVALGSHALGSEDRISNADESSSCLGKRKCMEASTALRFEEDSGKARKRRLSAQGSDQASTGSASTTAASPCGGLSLYDGVGSPDIERRGADATEVMAAAKGSQRQLIGLIGDALENVASLNDCFCSDPCKLTTEDDNLLVFRSSQRPSFLFRDYLARLVHYLSAWRREQTGHACDVGLRSLLIAIIYADRIHQMHPRARVSTFNMHRIILTGMLVATKFTEDSRVSNRFWSQVGGIELAELNQLEFQFCALLKFDLFVHPDEYESCFTLVSRLMPADNSSNNSVSSSSGSLSITSSRHSISNEGDSRTCADEASSRAIAQEL